MASADQSQQPQQPPQRRIFGFVFPMASGHINPSLPVARALVGLGHEVHYLCREQMRAAVEDTGAAFHSELEWEPELYDGREPDLHGALEALRREAGLDKESFFIGAMKVKYPMLEMALPGTLRWLRHVRAQAVCYCPIMNDEAVYASKVLGIPSVGLITTAGPGSLPPAFRQFMASFGETEEGIREGLQHYQPHLDALERMNSKYGLGITRLPNLSPVGKLDHLKHSTVTLVTTCEDLQDPMTPKLAAAYEEEGVRFEAVGPLLDKEGAHRAAGHRFGQDGASEERPAEAAAKQAGDAPEGEDLLRQVHDARVAGRGVVLVSMGTVITGDHPEIGWEGRNGGEDSKRCLAGRELCRAAWGAAFDVFGRAAADEGPLLVVALGPQPQALGDLVPPANAFCMPMVPQVDVLRAGIDTFLTHGGQNSFTEGLAHAAPVVVCPGFGDQAVNARKAEALGAGLQVPRPACEEGAEEAVAARYRRDVAAALRRVFTEDSFRQAALGCATRLGRAGGVPRAVEVMLEAAAAGAAGIRGEVDIAKDAMAEREADRIRVSVAGA